MKRTVSVAMNGPPRWEVGAFAAAFATSGLVALALVLAGQPTYESLAREGGYATATFRVIGEDGTVRATTAYDLATLVELHGRTLAYVLGDAAALPRAPRGGPLYTPDEARHLADVRSVLAWTRLAMLAGFAIVLLLVTLALRRRRVVVLRLLRDGALAAAVGSALVAAAAALAFEPLFLAFHAVVFPQGNFLFDPATSNLITLYPDPYWYGVTLRVGAAFLAVASLGAAVAAATLRVFPLDSPP